MNYSMNIEMWNGIKNFTPDDFGAINMSGILVFTIQAMRNYVKRRIFINSGYREGSRGYHPLMMAADLYIENMHVVDQLLTAMKFDVFNGIGGYLWWNNPGIHIDTRPKGKLDRDARWLSVKRDEYLPMTAENLKLFY